ncbi:HNH endonuclease signature motif containing protein [Pseudonocardia spinosispora]|uniref:HNH endonuclease signature motif containing protein n=1 Tax=Pseudonocardia spinosispora TaxID=103441 RepID=UPI00068630E6|nr:HNH endonuclease signature motif containing protein [Pseudonocardia spinosispora]
MSEVLVRELRAEAVSVMARLRDAEKVLSDQALIESIQFHDRLQRQSKQDVLRSISRLDSEGGFVERGVRAKSAVADLLGVRPSEAHRLVRLARHAFPTVTLTGQPVAARLSATAAALDSHVIDQAHGLVIDIALRSSAARRLDPGIWGGAESILAEWAQTYTPAQLAVEARRLVNGLDHDGARPGDDDSGVDGLVNDLSFARHQHGGGFFKGRLDALSFEVFRRALDARLLSEKDENKSLAERQGDALAQLCVHALDEGCLPQRGGERPHVTVILTEKELREQHRGVVLEYGGQLSAAQTRMLLCDAKILPVVLGGESQILDVGREKRTATPAQRAAITARDGGCAHPGCDQPPHHCEIHHLTPWAHGGRTDIDNLAMFCWQHHRMIHESGWTINMVNGYPSIIPPKWLDSTQMPRRKPPPIIDLETILRR